MGPSPRIYRRAQHYYIFQRPCLGSRKAPRQNKTESKHPTGPILIALPSLLARASLRGSLRGHSRRYRAALSALAPLLFLTAPPAAHAVAQEAAPSDRPNVFFDCSGPRCNFDYYRTEIDWVNWVRDDDAADVHVIITSLSTGGGGREFRFDYIGHGEYEEYERNYVYQSLSTDTEREQLDGFAHALGVGLASFANTAGFRGIVRLVGTGPEDIAGQRVVARSEVEDPWDLWVFRINGSGEFDGESSRKSVQSSGSFSVSRVTPTWKVRTNARFSYRRLNVELDDGDFSDTRVDWNFNQTAVYALADHWSAGMQLQSARTTRFNQRLRVELTPVVEYSFFPYDEATRRSMTASYRIGGAYREYFETTTYEQDEETRWEHSFEIDFSQRQDWGDAGVTLQGSQFLHDPSLYNVLLRGDIDYRVVRGFSINARGNIQWVKDQIYLSAQGATDEEALLALRRRATSYEYSLRLGFSFQFGSLFNNVVNNRFRGIQGFN